MSLALGRDPGAVVCLPAQTARMAELLGSLCDLLVVDVEGVAAIHGLPDPAMVTLEMIILHGSAVMRGGPAAAVAVELPMAVHQAGPLACFRCATSVLKSTGAQAIVLRATPASVASMTFLAQRKICVVASVTDADAAASALGAGAAALLVDAAVAAGLGQPPDHRVPMILRGPAPAQAQRAIIAQAVQRYAQDVVARRFPGPAETYFPLAASGAR